MAVLMRHMAGNMRSRWVNFLTSDGEKPDRMRDREFEDPGQSREELLAEWEHGWQCVFDALTPLTDADLQRTVMIRGEPHSVYKAICRQVAHYAGHAYQILLLAKHMCGQELEDALDSARPIRGIQPAHARQAESRTLTVASARNNAALGHPRHRPDQSTPDSRVPRLEAREAGRGRKP